MSNTVQDKLHNLMSINRVEMMFEVVQKWLDSCVTVEQLQNVKEYVAYRRPLFDMENHLPFREIYDQMELYIDNRIMMLDPPPVDIMTDSRSLKSEG